jgi:hypothetical protein
MIVRYHIIYLRIIRQCDKWGAKSNIGRYTTDFGNDECK